jgi:acyl carrier protein
MEDVREDIKKFILATFPTARKHNISYEESLLETGIIDSLGVLEIVTFLAEQLHVDVDDEDLTQDNFINIISIADLIKRKKA